MGAADDRLYCAFTRPTTWGEWGQLPVYVCQAVHSGMREVVFTADSVAGGLREEPLCGEDEGNNETIETQHLCKNEDQDHVHE